MAYNPEVAALLQAQGCRVVLTDGPGEFTRLDFDEQCLPPVVRFPLDPGPLTLDTLASTLPEVAEYRPEVDHDGRHIRTDDGLFRYRYAGRR
ncbi:MAG: hypothetical protein ACRDPR_20530 [Nocardioidaceae bacterium]